MLLKECLHFVLLASFEWCLVLCWWWANGNGNWSMRKLLLWMSICTILIVLHTVLSSQFVILGCRVNVMNIHDASTWTGWGVSTLIKECVGSKTREMTAILQFQHLTVYTVKDWRQVVLTLKRSLLDSSLCKQDNRQYFASYKSTSSKHEIQDNKTVTCVHEDNTCDNH